MAIKLLRIFRTAYILKKNTISYDSKVLKTRYFDLRLYSKVQLDARLESFSIYYCR